MTKLTTLPWDAPDDGARSGGGMAAEHEASAAVGRWLGAAYEAAATHRGETAPILIGLPPGARHELGALAFATAASSLLAHGPAEAADELRRRLAARKVSHRV